ncbi:hypothetical protein OC845_006155 [Tilletia horrida]|nr:hypothetical protein OC845_006155 [Tilletia horrida]
MKRSLLLAAISLMLPSVLAWETPAEAAQQARALLHDPTIFGVATLSSIYPADFRIPELRGRVASGPEYFAPCYENGDLVMIALTVSQNWRNVLPSFGGSGNATVTVSANPDPSVPDARHATKKGKKLSWDPHRPQWRRGMPSKGRITLFGSIEELSKPSSVSSPQADDQVDVAKCFLSYHHDAGHWAPGAKDSPHSAIWIRFKTEQVYQIGGFGDEHSIRFLPIDEYRKAHVPKLDSAAYNHDNTTSEGTLNLDIFFGDSDNGPRPVPGDAPALRFQKPISI